MKHPKNFKKEKVDQARSKFLDGIGVPEIAEFSADPFQLRAVESVLSGADTLVVAPTGTGKTFIAIEGIKRVIKQGQRAVYTTPLKALSNTKYTEFKALFEPEYSVGLLTGDRKIEGDASIVVATTEIYRNDLYNYGEIYSLVILDELHYLADPQRGPVWEESIILSPKSANLLMLSASISNAEEIAQWIAEVRGKKVNVISETQRKVPLRLGFLHPELGVVPLEGGDGDVSAYVSDFYQTGGVKKRMDWPRRRGREGGSGESQDNRPRNKRPGDRRPSKKKHK